MAGKYNICLDIGGTKVVGAIFDGNKEIVYPRQLAMYLCRDLTQTPLQQIGQILGGRDHTTIIHGLEKISTELKLKPELEHTVSVLRKKISIQ